MQQVESYLIEECQELITDTEKLEEWKSKVEELGLEGQKGLTKEGKSPIPFPAISAAHWNMWGTLCPENTTVEKYSGEAIPLRVLSLIALCRQEKYFQLIEVWSDRTWKDPIIVGYKGDNRYSNSERYMIARWGDELLDEPSLMRLAREKKIFQSRAKLTGDIAEAQVKLGNIEALVDKHLTGEWVNL